MSGNVSQQLRVVESRFGFVQLKDAQKLLEVLELRVVRHPEPVGQSDDETEV